MSTDSFKNIGDLLQKLIEKNKWEKFLALENIKKDWPAVVGENIAGHTIPTFIKDKKLFIDVDSPIWSNQLNYLKTKVISTINSYYNKEVIKDIFFKIKSEQ